MPATDEDGRVKGVAEDETTLESTGFKRWQWWLVAAISLLFFLARISDGADLVVAFGGAGGAAVVTVLAIAASRMIVRLAARIIRAVLPG
jgi:hypothetical protein